ncbi:hypothetical protein MMC11_004733 [Xylographa trunciseda]|nr:hypothetical protein [Xylographa trunciseda]
MEVQLASPAPPDILHCLPDFHGHQLGTDCMEAFDTMRHGWEEVEYIRGVDIPPVEIYMQVPQNYVAGSCTITIDLGGVSERPDTLIMSLAPEIPRTLALLVMASCSQRGAAGGFATFGMSLAGFAKALYNRADAALMTVTVHETTAAVPGAVAAAAMAADDLSVQLRQVAGAASRPPTKGTVRRWIYHSLEQWRSILGLTPQTVGGFVMEWVDTYHVRRALQNQQPA